MKMKETIAEAFQKVLALSEQKVALLKECIESIKYEECEYHLEREKHYPNLYYLVKIKNGELLTAGRIDRIRSYLRLRKIDTKKIYGNTLLES